MENDKRWTILAALKSAWTQIYTAVKKHPRLYGTGVIALFFVQYLWLLSPWTEGKSIQQYTDFVIAVFTESIIIAATVIVVQAFIEKRIEENRDLAYEAVFEAAYRLYNSIFRLVYTMMTQSLFRGRFRLEALNRSAYKEISESDIRPIIREFFRESRHHSIRVNKSAFSRDIWHLYADVDDFLQYYAPFLTSDATGEAGSRLLNVFSSIRNTLRELQILSDVTTTSLHDARPTGDEEAHTDESSGNNLRTETHDEILLRFLPLNDKRQMYICAIDKQISVDNEVRQHRIELHGIDGLEQSETSFPWIDMLLSFLAEMSSAERRRNLEEKYFSGNKGTFEFCTAATLLAIVHDDAESNVAEKIDRVSSDALPVAFPDTLKCFFRPVANADASACNYLGILFRDSSPGDTSDARLGNLAEAVRWFRRAAEQKHPDGMYNLGVMYKKGSGVEQSDAKAAHWVCQAAERDHIDGQYKMGLMFQSGRGVKHSDNSAAFWFEKAADQGHAEAVLARISHQGGTELKFQAPTGSNTTRMV